LLRLEQLFLQHFAEVRMRTATKIILNWISTCSKYLLTFLHNAAMLT